MLKKRDNERHQFLLQQFPNITIKINNKIMQKAIKRYKHRLFIKTSTTHKIYTKKKTK